MNLKVSSIKNYIRQRYTIIKASIVFNFYNETAYGKDTWASLLSTFFYNVAYITFIKVIFTNTKTIAGYTYDEVMLFYIIFETGGYINYIIGGWQNVRQLIIDINRGDLDMILTKPIPSLFFVTFKNIKLFSGIRDGLPPLVVVALFINWSSFNFNLANILGCIIIFICGITCVQIFTLISAIPTFWLGEGDSLLGMVNETMADAGGAIPWEGYSSTLKVVFTVLMPALFMGAISTSVLLGKSDITSMVLFSVTVTVIFIFIQNYLWNFALKHYTSASS